jgi:hypothetical protein
MVALGNLLEGIESQSQFWGQAVKKITHDTQMQFEKSMMFWHQLFSNASPEPLTLPGEKPIVLRRVFQSQFAMSSSETSPGI